MRIFIGLLFASSLSFFSFAQSPPANPPATPPVAYETATLPKDRVQAWEMLRTASGLGDDTLQPWYLHATYKTYDAYGKPKGEGTMEYVWAGPKKWRENFTEGGLAWIRWETEQGSFGAPKQAGQLSYPASLIVGQIRDPLGLKSSNKLSEPHTVIDKKLGGAEIACLEDFTYQALSSDGKDVQGPSSTQYCTLSDKPILSFAEADYTVLYRKAEPFQHRFTAFEVHIRDGRDPVIDIDIDALRTPSTQETALLALPPDAVSRTDDNEDGYSAPSNDHAIRKVPPSYPIGAKKRRSEGTVRLAILIAKDGHTHVTDVLHTPDPELTGAAEKAVEQWMYEPYMKNGQPMEVQTQVKIQFMLGR